jgi:hypothetical protein
MPQKNTLFNYFTKSPAHSKIQNGGGVAPSESIDKIVQKSDGGALTLASKEVSKKSTPKRFSKKTAKSTAAVTDHSKQNEGEGNCVFTFSDIIIVELVGIVIHVT